jgi:hypothetical protein
MKLPVFIFLTFFLFTGCKKNNYTGCIDLHESGGLNGTWELRSQIGGMMPDNDFPPGNGNIIKFTDSTFEKRNNGQITINGTYIISQVTNPETGNTMKQINYPGGYIEYFKIMNNHLTIYSGLVAADGTISKYARE